jgi:hypothetical protein
MGRTSGLTDMDAIWPSDLSRAGFHAGVGIEALAQLDQELAEVECPRDDGRHADPLGIQLRAHGCQGCHIEPAFRQPEPVTRIRPEVPERDHGIDVIFDRVRRRQPGRVRPPGHQDLDVGSVGPISAEEELIKHQVSLVPVSRVNRGARRQQRVLPLGFGAPIEPDIAPVFSGFCFSCGRSFVDEKKLIGRGDRPPRGVWRMPEKVLRVHPGSFTAGNAAPRIRRLAPPPRLQLVTVVVSRCAPVDSGQVS